eukprot:2726459-Ditylum_brightwellii.AAC.1
MGTGLPFLHEVVANRSYVPASWLYSIRTFLCLCKGKVSMPNAWLPIPQQSYNQIIMDVFGTLQFSLLTLERLNAVRLYLGVLTLADIVSDNGYYIMDWALTGQTKAKPMIPWPNQGMPFNVCWDLWHKYLKQCFSPTTSRSHQLNKSIKLHQPLGEQTTRSLYAAWQYYYAQCTNQ